MKVKPEKPYSFAFGRGQIGHDLGNSSVAVAVSSCGAVRSLNAVASVLGLSSADVNPIRRMVGSMFVTSTNLFADMTPVTFGLHDKRCMARNDNTSRMGLYDHIVVQVFLECIISKCNGIA